MQDYIDYIKAILFFGVVGSFLLWIAKSNGFFRFPTASHGKTYPVLFKHVLSVFAIYLGFTSLIAPFLGWVIESFYVSFLGKLPTEVVFSWVQLGLLGAILLLFYLYSKTQGPLFFKHLWKNRFIDHPQSVPTDFFMGVLTWFIGFPFVVVVGQCVDLILHAFFGFQNYEQVAVRYLKTTLESPQQLAVALMTILILAPCIEEFLFRGCLQSFLKRHMSTKEAIVLSSLCFALFHFSLSQGLGNISLCASLFVFALFLGFIYERQASLFASVGLHITFNAVSTGQILFFP
jgi:hypothetical protein